MYTEDTPKNRDKMLCVTPLIFTRKETIKREALKRPA